MNEQLRQQRIREAEIITKSLREAIGSLTRAERDAWLWADTVRQCIEDRLGVEFVSDDPRILSDAEYDRALERCRQMTNAVARAVQLLDEWTKAELS